MKLKMIIRNQSVTIISTDSEVLTVMDQLRKDFTIMEKVPDPYKKGQFRIVKGNTFTGGNELIDENIFSINALNEVFYFLQSIGIKSSDIDMIDKRKDDYEEVSIEIADGKTDREYQSKFINAIVKTDNPSVLVDLQTGMGKSVCDNTPIYKVEFKDDYREIVPIRIGDVKVGDNILDDTDDYTEVLEVFPQGVIKLFNVVFEDGRHIYASLDHLWKVCIDGIWSVDNTNTIMLAIIAGKKCSIPRIASELQVTKSDSLDITSIQFSHYGKATCITVDNESKLFLCGENILTHNTYIASKSLSIIKHRVAIVVLPKYIPKWIGDVKENLKVTDDDIMIISGGHNIRKLIQMAKDKVEIPKILIFSNRTLYNYIKSYESFVDESLFEYDMRPYDLLDKLDVGVTLVDETHQEFYSVFKTSLYFNSKLFLGLSATLITSDPKLNKMYNTLFPNKSRLSFMAYNKYIIAKSESYIISNMRGISFNAPGNRGYSHIALEKSILRKSILLKGYLKMIHYYVKRDYIKEKKKGDKCLVFCATIDMCGRVVDYLTKHNPELDIRRYTGDDPYENVIEPDIRVTTIQSSGAAIDIPGLIHVVQTVSINSPQANLQAIGRLREIKGRDVIVTCLWTRSIPKQRQYHENKKKLFDGKIKKMLLSEYPGYLTC